MSLKNYRVWDENNFLLFLKEFFTKKTNIFWLLILITTIAFIAMAFLFYPYSGTKPLNDNLIFNSFLPPYTNPIVTKQILPGSEIELLENIKKTHPEFNLEVTNITDSVGNVISNFKNVKYDVYQLFNFLEKQQYSSYLGTNSQGIDNFAAMISALGQTYLLAFIALLGQIFLSTIFGAYLGLKFNYKFSQLAIYLYRFLIGIPFVLISILLFSFIPFNFFTAALIFGLISSLFFVVFAYEETLEIKNQEFFLAAIGSGFKTSDLIFRILFFRILTKKLLLMLDYFVLIVLTIIALYFLSVNNIQNQLTIGSVLNDAIEVVTTNTWFLISFILLNLALVLSLRMLFENIYNNQQKESQVI